ncbi:hypothetical protein VNO78_12098 [Psophocarpus tetragonolobus]|uniref:Uncharacterized protein n=1 Tax=Psophocarpus tetragonolobus TaxID=3891 RepID=A0AAN9SQB3_PSOTE
MKTILYNQHIITSWNACSHDNTSKCQGTGCLFGILKCPRRLSIFSRGSLEIAYQLRRGFKLEVCHALRYSLTALTILKTLGTCYLLVNKQSTYRKQRVFDLLEKLPSDLKKHFCHGALCTWMKCNDLIWEDKVISPKIAVSRPIQYYNEWSFVRRKNTHYQFQSIIKHKHLLTAPPLWLSVILMLQYSDSNQFVIDICIRWHSGEFLHASTMTFIGKSTFQEAKTWGLYHKIQ